ncbi:hypothetical protein DAEQUDRAFT_720438 [Daedalea quercina L-15889]|uniref:Uncharacterized protein n=1 Tax=Daedalea quercina L-15889 TaxID=1314783 RepID=A0A165U1Z6_9APHY|nr:hypothetical protein DAEQUDRAFT_720438 [Daedalea quercina L-15889]
MFCLRMQSIAGIIVQKVGYQQYAFVEPLRACLFSFTPRILSCGPGHLANSRTIEGTCWLRLPMEALRTFCVDEQYDTSRHKPLTAPVGQGAMTRMSLIIVRSGADAEASPASRLHMLRARMRRLRIAKSTRMHAILIYYAEGEGRAQRATSNWLPC